MAKTVHPDDDSKNGKSGGAFLTQKGERVNEVKNEIVELEQLLAAAGQTSQSTLLLKKRKELREIDESLELMKKDYKRRMDICEEKRVAFEAKQAKMREQVLKFEKFIQENDAKRQRAEAKAKVERKAFEDKAKEISILAAKIVKLEVEQKELHHQLVTKSRYKSYLESIVEEGAGDYEEIGEILNRYNTLVEANRDLMQHSDEQERAADDLSRIVQALKNEKQNALLVNISLLQNSQKGLEQIKLDVKNEEGVKIMEENKRKNVSQQLSQTTQAIRNLYSRCYTSLRNKPVFAGNRETATVIDLLDYELDVSEMRISDLREISIEYKQMADSAPPIPAGGELRDNSILSAVSNPVKA